MFPYHPHVLVVTKCFILKKIGRLTNKDLILILVSSTETEIFLLFLLTLITYGGGGLFGPDDQVIDHNSKRLYLAPPLVTFSFYLLDTFWQNFSKNVHQQGCYSCF